MFCMISQVAYGTRPSAARRSCRSLFRTRLADVDVPHAFDLRPFAKHIVAAGVKRVVYIEPYEKSQALDLHDDAIVIDDHGDTSSRSDREEDGARATKKVVFEPFMGIGPRRFFDLFSMKLSNGDPDRRRRDPGVVGDRQEGQGRGRELAGLEAQRGATRTLRCRCLGCEHGDVERPRQSYRALASDGQRTPSTIASVPISFATSACSGRSWLGGPSRRAATRSPTACTGPAAVAHRGARARCAGSRRRRGGAAALASRPHRRPRGATTLSTRVARG
jgi:hypothetical protein